MSRVTDDMQKSDFRNIIDELQDKDVEIRNSKSKLEKRKNMRKIKNTNTREGLKYNNDGAQISGRAGNIKVTDIGGKEI